MVIGLAGFRATVVPLPVAMAGPNESKPPWLGAGAVPASAGRAFSSTLWLPAKRTSTEPNVLAVPRSSSSPVPGL
ncbi:hypothetical protein GCM10025734_44800 [Kitasatospora paranensis]|uniref:hypothetical protein n=1 Tax=Kitasatospora paranensis TaxID=258053 RepID=UPI0031EF7ED0